MVGRGEGAELVLERRVEPLDRLDQAEEADLLDVLEGLAAVGEATRDVVDEVAVELDEPLADARIAGFVELAKQAPHLGPLGRLRGLRDGPLAGRHAVAATRRGGHDALYLVSRTRRLPVRSSTR